MKGSTLAAALMILVIGAPTTVAAQYPCNEACRQIVNEGGQHQGYACTVGTQGDGCVATVEWCQITYGGCPGSGSEQEAALAGAPFQDGSGPFRAGVLSAEDGQSHFVTLPCDLRVAPMVLSAYAVQEVVERVPRGGPGVVE